MTTKAIPQAFLWRRLHSLTGMGLVIFVIFHLFTNSQAALFFGDDGRGFIYSVNSIHHTPYLLAVEILLLALPILIHTIWGINYLRSASYSSFGKNGHDPYLPEYPRNHAYTWQRITSWLLVVGILAHVIHMRWIEYPQSALQGQSYSYMVKVSQDEGLYPLALRLGVKLYTSEEIQSLKSKAPLLPPIENSVGSRGAKGLQTLIKRQTVEQELNWLKTLEKRPLNPSELMAVSEDFGTAELLMVRNTFKSPQMIALYTLFVVTTCFHAFNGLWTFMISWGVALTPRAQYLIRLLSVTMMVGVGGLGLSAIWLTYWINLKS